MERKVIIIQTLLEKLETLYKYTLKEMTVTSNAAFDPQAEKKDLRHDSVKVELNYLASSLSEKASGLEKEIRQLSAFSFLKYYESVSLGTIVTINNNGAKQILFILPAGGGQKIQFNNEEITVLSKTSPLYLAISGRRISSVTTFNGRRIEIQKIE